MVWCFARGLFGELRLSNPETGGALAIIDLPDSVVASEDIRHQKSCN